MAGGKRQTPIQRHKPLWPQLQLESSETQGEVVCSASLKNKLSVAQCYPVQTITLMERVEFEARLCSPSKTCGQRCSNCRIREGEEPLPVMSCLTQLAATTRAQGMHGLPGKRILTPSYLKYRRQICISEQLRHLKKRGGVLQSFSVALQMHLDFRLG